MMVANTKNNKDSPWFWGLVILLSIAYTASYSSILLSLTDPARDLIFASRIAQGIDLVTYGPVLNGDFHMGPMWFYWLAIPALSGSTALMLFWAGLTAASKFVFAYAIGRTLNRPYFGVLFALLLLLPSWNQFELIAFTHTNLVAGTSLAFAYLFIRFTQTKDPRWLKWLALSFSLALHAHPTTIGLVVLPLTYIIGRIVSGHIPWQSIVASLLWFTLPFSPYLVQQICQGFPLLEQLAQSQQASYFSGQRLRYIPAVLTSLFAQGPQVLMDYVADAYHPGVANLLRLSYWLILALSGAGTITGMIHLMRHQQTGRLLSRIVLLSLLGFSILAATVLMKPNTTFYMTFVIFPFISALLAFGLCHLPLPRSIVLLATSFLAILSLFATSQANLTRGTQDLDYFHGDVLTDVKKPYGQRRTPVHFIDTYLARDNDLFGQFICARSQTERLTGPPLTLLATSLGAAYQFTCPPDKIATFSATASTAAYTLLNQSIITALSLQPEQWMAGYGVLAVAQVIHDEGLQLDLFDAKTYRHPNIRDLSQSAKRTWQEAVTLPSKAYLVINNIYLYMPYPNITVVDSQAPTSTPLEPVYENYTVRIYQNHSDKPIQWQINAVDVVEKSTSLVILTNSP